MSNLFEHCRAGVSTAKPKIRKVERRNKRQLDYAERKHLRRSRRLGNSGIALSRCFSGSDRTEKPHRIHVVGIIGQTGMLRPPESDAAGVPHTLRNDALQPIVMGRQPRFHIGKRVVKRIVDAAERRRKRPIFAQYRPVQVDERHSAHPQKGAFPKIIAAIFFIERRATQLRQIPARQKQQRHVAASQPRIGENILFATDCRLPRNNDGMPPNSIRK